MMKEEFYLTKKKDEITIRSSAAEYLTYIASVGDQADSIEMRYEDENIWLTQKMMATLYDVDVRTINYHIKKIFSDSELQENLPPASSTVTWRGVSSQVAALSCKSSSLVVSAAAVSCSAITR